MDFDPVTRSHLPHGNTGVMLTQIWEVLHSFSGNHGNDFMGQWG